MEYTSLSLVAVVLCSFAAMPALSMTDEKRLSKHLVENYERVGIWGRPVLNSSDKLDVNIGFSLLKIINFDQERHELSLLGWVEMKWEDILLKWDPTDFGGSERLVLKPAHIWSPDIVLLNAVEKPKLIHDVSVSVTSEGSVTGARQMSIKVFCDPARSADIHNDKPDDPPNCDLKFGTWTMTTQMVDLRSTLDRMDTSHYVRHLDWEVYKTKARQSEISNFPCCLSDTFPAVTYTITLKPIPKEDEDDDDKDSGATAAVVSNLVIVCVLSLFTTSALH